MNWDQIERKWNQMQGALREKWDKLTDNDWETVAGKRDLFLGKLQERYSYSREEAERQLRDWERSLQSRRVA